jgi:uncharacterized protein YcfL
MRLFCLGITYLFLLGCASPKQKIGAPMNSPKPKASVSAEKINTNIISISKSINEANFRAEKIRLMLGELD